MLYHLAKNPDVQNKLYQETCELLPHYLDDIDTEKLNQARYTKAVLKESLRLNPISVGIGRILTNDKIFSGYLVPKNVGKYMNFFNLSRQWIFFFFLISFERQQL